MHLHRRTLGRNGRGHVDPCGDLRFRGAERFEIDRRVVVVPFWIRHHHLAHLIPIDHALVHVLHAGYFRGAHSYAVHLNVVGVPVTAVAVVQRDDIRLLLAEHSGQTFGRLLDGDIGEGVRAVVLRRAGHPGVGVAERDQAVRAQDAGRLLQFGSPALGKRFARDQQSVGDLTRSTVGGRDEYHPVAGIGGEPDDPAGAEHLVVGMSVEADEDTHESTAT